MSLRIARGVPILHPKDPRTVPKATVERLLTLRRITHYGPRRLAYYLSQESYHLSVFGPSAEGPGTATSGPGEETPLPASEAPSELRYAGSRPASSSGREVSATSPP